MIRGAEKGKKQVKAEDQSFIPMHHIDEKMSNNFIDTINFG